MRTFPPSPTLALAAALLAVGCSGPRETSSRVKVNVETTPPGAMVTVSDSSGRRALGRAPLEHEVEYVESVYESHPGWWITTGITGALTAIGVGMFVAGLGEDIRSSDGTLLRENGDDTMAVVGGSIGFTAATTLLIVLPLAIIDSAVAGDVLWSMPRHGPVAYEADLPGYRGASSFLAPTVERPWKVELSLAEDGVGGGGLGLVARAGPEAQVLGSLEGGVVSGRSAGAPFVAVFDVEDRSGLLDARTIAALTDQLATKLVEQRAFRVVPATDLRARLVEAKKASYGACIDERCQIELGKAVAADRTLSARVIKVGETCTVNGTLYDLKTEATDRAASVRGSCSVEALVEAIDALATKLSKD